MSKFLEATGISKTYHLRRVPVMVLDGADLSVAEGETVAIIGRSGAGKSTLLHILGGLDCPDAGTVRVREDDLYALSAGRRTAIRAHRIGFVFQSYHLLPEMDVLENVMLPAMAYGGARTRRQGREHARRLLETVGLADRARHRPMELSGGEQQRVALARALMNDPELILADEPTGNLDDSTGAIVLDRLFLLAREHGRALVMVTHNREIAERCDRILRLTDGRITAARMD
jgi:predicted ABC-type transport system involved in lysophospholipase L1 biosynthesis ATPase subunit